MDLFEWLQFWNITKKNISKHGKIIDGNNLPKKHWVACWVDPAVPYSAKPHVEQDGPNAQQDQPKFHRFAHFWKQSIHQLEHWFINPQEVWTSSFIKMSWQYPQLQQQFPQESGFSYHNFRHWQNSQRRVGTQTPILGLVVISSWSILIPERFIANPLRELILGRVCWVPQVPRVPERQLPGGDGEITNSKPQRCRKVWKPSPDLKCHENH